MRADAIRRGDELASRGEHASAAAAYQAAVAVDLRDGATRLKLSKSLRAAEDWAAGAREGISAADLLPDDLDAQLWGISMRLSQAQFVDAFQRVEQLLEKYPEHPTLLIQAGNATAHLIDPTWALFRLNEALRLHEEYDWTRQSLRVKTQEPEDKAAEALFRRALAREPEMVDARLALVNLLWASGRPEQAEPLLRRLADEMPGHQLVNAALGRYYLRKVRFADAETYLGAAKDAGDPTAVVDLADVYLHFNRLEDVLRSLDGNTSAEAALRVAEAERRLGRFAEARRHLEGVLGRQGGHPEAWRKKAELLLETGDPTGALSAARTAVERAPMSSAAHLVLARASSATGDVEGAFEQFTETARLDPSAKHLSRELARLALALGRDQTAVDYAREAVHNDANDREARIDLSKALMRVHDLAAAESALAPLLGDAASSEVLVLSGRIQAALGRSSAARSAYLGALKTSGDAFDAVSGLVALDLAAGRTADARARADEALRAHPDSPAHLRLAATAAVAAQAIPHAETLLARASTIDPSDPATLLLLADVLARLERKGEAIQLLERAVAQREPTIEIQLALAGRLDEAGRTADARRHYEAAVARFPDSARAAVGLAALYARLDEQLDVALNLASSAKQRLPRDPLVSDTLGWVYVRRGLPSIGLRHLEDAVRGEPTNPVFHYHLGQAYLATGDHPRARAAFTRALSLNPEFPHASDTRAAMASLTR